MKAIQKLRATGMTRPDIARAINVKRHTVRFWELGLRSPNHDNREKLIELAESKGILLLASDFTNGQDNNTAAPQKRAS